MIRHPLKIPVQFVLEHVGKVESLAIDGYTIRLKSQRYRNFKRNGLKCACCGIEGVYFTMDKHLEEQPWHLNLYAVDADGGEVLMTKDHIIPRSRGGSNRVDNYQTMCVNCNVRKGNTLTEKE